METKLQGSSEKEIFDKMTALWEVMKESVHEGLATPGRSRMGLSGGDSKKLLDYLGITSDGDTLIEVIEVVVVVCISDGKSSDDFRREISA